MKNILLLISTLFVLALSAQPTIVYDDSHSIGITGELYIISGPTASLQQTGPNLTWDFSSNTLTLAGAFDIVDPSTTPDGANYPDANTCLKQVIAGQGTEYTYVIDTPTELLSIAAEIGGNNPTEWIQPDKLVEYPFEYEDSFESTRQSSTGIPQTFTRTYDAYGTLIINGNTYTDVVRINKEPGQAVWYTSSPTWFPILIELSDNLYSFNEPDFTATIIDSTVENNISIFPNPSMQNTIVSVSSELVGKSFWIIDSMGKQVISDSIKSSNHLLSLENLSSGLYMLVIINDDKKFSKILIRE